MLNRLSKILAAAGVASRRAAEKIITSGRVKVNGEVILLPQFMVNDRQDKILVDGAPIAKGEEKIYFALNKPKGYLCSHVRRYTEKLIFDLLPPKKRLFSIGRLDKESSGLIIITNDGHFAHGIAHPSFEVEKEYLVKVKEEITAPHLKKIASGIDIDGKWVQPISVKKVRRGTCKVVVHEGKKHEVRKMVQEAFLEIIELKRIRIGHLFLGNLPEGAYRPLSQKEVNAFLRSSTT
jgi:23S rRNA pseudouridine2605 synthase